MNILVLTTVFALLLAATVAADVILEKRKAALPARLADLIRRYHLDAAVVFMLSLIIYSLFCNHRFIDANNYMYFARALTQGRLDIPDMPGWMEQVTFNGKTYMHFAPGGVLLVLPFYFLGGLKFNLGLIDLLFAAANVSLFYILMGRFSLSTRARLWMAALFGFGTVHFWLAIMGDSWFFGQVAALFFLLIALIFLFQKKDQQNPSERLNPFLSGLFYGLAASTRFPLVLSGLLFGGVIFFQRKKGLQQLMFFALGAAIPLGLYFLINYLRYGTIMDQGYALCFHKDQPDNPYGPLQLKHAPYNLYSIFVMAPVFLTGYPFLKPTIDGVAMTITTPALFNSVKARGSRLLIALLWLTAAVVSVPFVLLWGNGSSQFGMRYTMDFVPFLLILTALGMKEMTVFNRALIAWCMVVNTWGVLYWNMFYLKGIW